MSMTEIVKVFGERKIRSVWDDVAEESLRRESSSSTAYDAALKRVGLEAMEATTYSAIKSRRILTFTKININ